MCTTTILGAAEEEGGGAGGVTPGVGGAGCQAATYREWRLQKTSQNNSSSSISKKCGCPPAPPVAQLQWEKD